MRHTALTCAAAACLLLSSCATAQRKTEPVVVVCHEIPREPGTWLLWCEPWEPEYSPDYGEGNEP